MEWSQAAGVWCFPIRTVSRSEGGIEGVYQSSAIIPHWHVTADEHGRWEVRIQCRVRQLAMTHGANGVPGERLAQRFRDQ